MSARDRRRARGSDTPPESYDDVPMPRAPSATSRSGGSSLPMVWIVVVVAIVAVVGFFTSPFGQRLAGYDFAALLTSAAGPDAAPDLELDRRIAEVEGALAAVTADAERLAQRTTALDDSEQLARIEQSLAALQAAAAAASEAATVAITVASDGLAARLTALEDAAAATAPLGPRVSVLEAAADDSSRARGISALRDRVSALEEAPAAAAQATVSAARLDAITDRIDTLERTRADAADTSARLALAARRIDAIEAAAGEAAAGEAVVDPAEVAGLARRIDELEAAGDDEADVRVAANAQRLDDLEAARAAVDEAALNSLELRLGALEAGLIDAAPEAEIRALESKLAALAQVAANAGRSAALAVAVARLREAARRSEPYAGALDEVRSLAGPLGDADLALALAAIAGRAAGGVPNLAALRDRFAGLAAPLLHAEGLDADAGWLAKTVNRLTSVVTVRRIGEVAGPTAEARIARAETRLAAGDLAAAIEDLAPLETAPGGLLTAWLADARARLALDAALDDVSQRALALLSAS